MDDTGRHLTRPAGLENGREKKKKLKKKKFNLYPAGAASCRVAGGEGGRGEVGRGAAGGNGSSGGRGGGRLSRPHGAPARPRAVRAANVPATRNRRRRRWGAVLSPADCSPKINGGVMWSRGRQPCFA
ncbi:hypothetical protein R5R35_007236 [Gryllus longicercus]|uniref:Uncharacterized protein n=1 Tax=Gryllus longicercus TaxID=2509291 RepID=A0AAN9VDT9_9ORTH